MAEFESLILCGSETAEKGWLYRQKKSCHFISSGIFCCNKKKFFVNVFSEEYSRGCIAIGRKKWYNNSISIDPELLDKAWRNAIWKRSDGTKIKCSARSDPRSVKNGNGDGVAMIRNKIRCIPTLGRMTSRSFCRFAPAQTRKWLRGARGRRSGFRRADFAKR